MAGRELRLLLLLGLLGLHLCKLLWRHSGGQLDRGLGDPGSDPLSLLWNSRGEPLLLLLLWRWYSGGKPLSLLMLLRRCHSRGKPLTLLLLLWRCHSGGKPLTLLLLLGRWWRRLSHLTNKF